MVKILDCTLRDGGHVNKWNFSEECILDTLKVAENSEIDYFEAGYNMPKCINSSKIKLCTMLDAKNIHPVSEKTDCVRIACYPHEIKTAIFAIEDFKNQGFEVFLHLMTADKFEDYELLKNWKNKDILTSIYFADSFGAFLPKDVEYLGKDNSQYLELIKKYYLDLQAQTPWGYSYKALIGGLNNIHPSQVIC